MASRWLRWAVAGSVAVSLIGGGCTTTMEHKVARFRNGTVPTTQPVPEGGWYSVKVARRGEDEYRKVRGTGVVLRGGEPAGFHVDEDGTVYATAGQRMMPLDLPEDWRRLMWYSHYETESEFGAGMNETLRVMAGAAVVAGVGTLIVVAAFSDDDDEKCRRRR